MSPLQPKEFMLYYAAFILLALVVFVRRRPRKGMRLRLRGSTRGGGMAEGKTYGDAASGLGGKQGPDLFSHIKPDGERPLNVVFNYNGHSWDAYEVLGLPAGSSPENVEAAYIEGMQKVDDASKPFLDAAYKAIQAQWHSYRAAGGG